MLKPTTRALRLLGVILLATAAARVLAWSIEHRSPAFQFERAHLIELTAGPPATRPWRLCALYPHLKDSYWLSVNYGMVAQAQRQGVELRVAEAGGYQQFERQWQQVQGCLAWPADAILLGTVSYEAINQRLQSQGSHPPLFGLVNNLSKEGLSGRVGVPWYRMGYLTGEFLASRHPAGTPGVKIAWFPGPRSIGGTPESESGLRDALAGSAVEVVASAHGDNDRNIQRTLLQQALDLHPDLDYVVGGAVLAEVAVNELARRGLTDRPQIISHYLSHGVYRGLKRGKILMANTDQMVLQGRLAVEQAIRILQGEDFPEDIGPAILQLSQDNRPWPITVPDSLSPAGFTPIYHVAP